MAETRAERRRARARRARARAEPLRPRRGAARPGQRRAAARRAGCLHARAAAARGRSARRGAAVARSLSRGARRLAALRRAARARGRASARVRSRRSAVTTTPWRACRPRATCCAPASAVLALAHLRLLAGDADAAARGARPVAGRPIRAWLASSCCCWPRSPQDARADHAAASVFLEQALRLSEPEGMRRPFADARAPSVRGLLRRQIRLGTAHRSLVDELLEALERPARGRRGPRRPSPRCSRTASWRCSASCRR